MTYAELLQSVATRLNRFDLLTPVPPSSEAVIPSFIQDRVLFYQRALYSPAEQLNYDLTCIPSQNTYMLPPGTQAVHYVRLLQGSIWIPLRRADWYQTILNVDALNPPFITLPYVYATYGQAIRLYPTPAFPYPLELMVDAAVPAPVNDADVNWWTSEAQTLVAEAACADICRAVLNDLPRAEEHEKLAAREHQSLKSFTQRLRGPSQISPYL